MARKGKRGKGDLFFDVIIVILLCVIAFSLFKVASILNEYQKGTREYKKIAKDADLKLEENRLHIDWKALKKKNSDVKAWIYSKGTVINYPVVQGDDNSFYLHRLLNKEYNFKGTLFIDYRVERPFDDFNTIIYGHRMKDGSMFKPLVKYREEDYYRKHKVMQLATPKHQYDLKIFAAVTIPARSSMYKCAFGTRKEKEAYLEKIREKNVLTTDVHVSANDRIVMMSTCTYEFDNARVVVYGKLIEKD